MLLFIATFFQSQAPLDQQVLSMRLYSFIFNPQIMHFMQSEWMSEYGVTSFRWTWEKRFERTGWHARIGRQAGKKRLDLLCSNGSCVRLWSLRTEWPEGGASWRMYVWHWRSRVLPALWTSVIRPSLALCPNLPVIIVATNLNNYPTRGRVSVYLTLLAYDLVT